MRYLERLPNINARTVVARVLLAIGALSITSCSDPLGANDQIEKELKTYNACIASVAESISEETGGPIPDVADIPVAFIDQCHLEAFGSEG